MDSGWDSDLVLDSGSGSDCSDSTCDSPIGVVSDLGSDLGSDSGSGSDSQKHIESHTDRYTRTHLSQDARMNKSFVNARIHDGVHTHHRDTRDVGLRKCVCESNARHVASFFPL